MNRLLAALLLLPLAARAEVCRFAGTTSYDGRVAVRAEATQAGDLLTVEVTADFSAHAWMTDYRYLGQEITTWRGGQLQSIAVNQRSLAGGSIKRQQWDVFNRSGPILEAFRAQAKYPDDFRQRFPTFTVHWPPATFGQPWLADFRRSGAERRPDLDLAAADARTPLAFAFYWSRFLPPGGGTVPLVLPSFKRDKQLRLDLGPATAGDGWQRWSTPLRHPALERGPASLAAAWVSPDHYLLQLSVDLRTGWANGQAVIRAEGCQGVQIRPD